MESVVGHDNTRTVQMVEETGFDHVLTSATENHVRSSVPPAIHSHIQVEPENSLNIVDNLTEKENKHCNMDADKTTNCQMFSDETKQSRIDDTLVCETKELEETVSICTSDHSTSLQEPAYLDDLLGHNCQ